MSPADDSFIADPVAAVEKDYTARLNRMFIVFAVVEGTLFALAVIAVYMLKLVDPDTGTLILVGIALLGGLALSTLLTVHMRARTRAVARARGENPLF